MPNGTPTNSASSTEDTPTSSEIRVPWMTRLNMSRPSWSVPSGWSQLGRSKVWVWSLAIGLRGASTSAKIATVTRSTTMPTPTSAVPLRRSRRNPCTSGDSERSAGARHVRCGTVVVTSASLRLPPRMGCMAIGPSGVPDPRIQERVGQVHDEVHDDEGECRQQGEPLHLLVVTRDDRVDAEGAEPRHREQRLHHDGAADEEADLQAHHGHGRDQRVLQSVLEHHRPLAQDLGASGRDVLSEDDLKHACAVTPS